jgi:hypothetical protein
MRANFCGCCEVQGRFVVALAISVFLLVLVLLPRPLWLDEILQFLALQMTCAETLNWIAINPGGGTPAQLCASGIPGEDAAWQHVVRRSIGIVNDIRNPLTDFGIARILSNNSFASFFVSLKLCVYSIASDSHGFLWFAPIEIWVAEVAVKLSSKRPAYETSPSQHGLLRGG